MYSDQYPFVSGSGVTGGVIRGARGAVATRQSSNQHGGGSSRHEWGANSSQNWNNGSVQNNKWGNKSSQNWNNGSIQNNKWGSSSTQQDHRFSRSSDAGANRASVFTRLGRGPGPSVAGVVYSENYNSGAAGGLRSQGNTAASIRGSFSSRQRYRGVIFGHSFVARLQKSLQPDGNCKFSNFSSHLGCDSNVEHIKMVGKGGAKIDELVKYFGSIRHCTDIDFMIIDLGTNDLCNTVDGKDLAREMVDRAKNLLLQHRSLKHISFNLVVRRDRCRQLSRADFETKRVAFNDELKDLVANSSNLSWFQTTLLDHEIRKWSSDGIHPNTQIGLQTYKNNVSQRVFQIVEKMLSRS